MISDPLFYVAAVPAVILVGLSKGGFAGLSLLSLPLLALVISPVQAAAIMLPILLVQDVVSVWAFRRSWDALNIRRLLPGAVLGILIGYLLAARVSDAAVQLIVGLIAVSFAAKRILAKRSLGEPVAAGADRLGGWIWGAAAGFTSMLVHAGGPPFQVYVLPQRLHSYVFAGTGAVFFAIVNWIKVAPYFALGQFTTANLKTSAVLFPLAVAATLAGVALVRRVSVERFYAIIYALLVVVGLKLIWDGVSGLL